MWASGQRHLFFECIFTAVPGKYKQDTQRSLTPSRLVKKSLSLWFEDAERWHASPSDFHTYLQWETRSKFEPKVKRGEVQPAISTWLRHYDAVQYLTTLLSCESSAAVWIGGERRGMPDANSNTWNRYIMRRVTDAEKKHTRRKGVVILTGLTEMPVCNKVFGQWVHAAKEKRQPL